MLSIIISIVLLILFISLTKRVDSIEKYIAEIEKNTNKNLVKISNISENIISNNSENIISNNIKKPNIDENILTKKIEFNLGKFLAGFGITVFCLGIFFLFAYMNSIGIISNSFKILLGIGVGIALITMGYFLKNIQYSYNKTLIIGGLISWYITIYSGFFLYNLFDISTAFIALFLTLFASYILTIKKDENDSVIFSTSYTASLILINVFFDEFVQNRSIINIILLLIILLSLMSAYLNTIKKWISPLILSFVFFMSLTIESLDIYTNDMQIWFFYTIIAIIYSLGFLITENDIDINVDTDINKNAGNNITNNLFKYNKESIAAVFTIINTLSFTYVTITFLENSLLKDYLGFIILILSIYHFFVFTFIKNTIADLHFIMGFVLIGFAIPIQFDGVYVTILYILEAIILTAILNTEKFKNYILLYIITTITALIGVSRVIYYSSIGYYKDVYETGVLFLNQNYLIIISTVIILMFIAFIINNLYKENDFKQYNTLIKLLIIILFSISQLLFIYTSNGEFDNFANYKNKVDIKTYTDKNIPNEENDVEYYKEYENNNKKINQIIAKNNNNISIYYLIFFTLLTAIYFLIKSKDQNTSDIKYFGYITLSIVIIKLFSFIFTLDTIQRIIAYIIVGVIFLILSYIYLKRDDDKDMHIDQNTQNIQNPNITNSALLFILIGITIYTSIPDIIFADNHLNNNDNKNNKTEINYNNWEFTQSIIRSNKNKDLELNKNGFYFINIQDKLNNQENSIRLLDGENNQIPYIILSEEFNDNNNYFKSNSYDKKINILEKSKLKDQYIILLDKLTEGDIINSINLIEKNINDKNFEYNIKTYISDTQLPVTSTAWRELEDKNNIYNYAINDKNIIEKTDLKYETGISSRYIKLILTTNKENNINIIDANSSYSYENTIKNDNSIKRFLSKKTFLNETRLEKINSIENVQNNTILKFSTNGKFEFLELNITNNSKDDYNRKIKVFGKNDNDNDYKYLFNENIYNINSDIYTGIDNKIFGFSKYNYKDFKLIIENENDKPLNVDEYIYVGYLSKYLIFKTDKSLDDIRIILGNKQADFPSYDLAKNIKYYEDNIVEEVYLENMMKNSDYIAIIDKDQFAKQNKLYINIALLLLATTTATIFYNLHLKKQIKENVKSK